jgi:uncharacterized protein YmfQ (DUF2313 family)
MNCYEIPNSMPSVVILVIDERKQTPNWPLGRSTHATASAAHIDNTLAWTNQEASGVAEAPFLSIAPLLREDWMSMLGISQV